MAEQNMTITHFGISHYRSIGEAPVMLDITKKINVLVGPNNAGKSNVLQERRSRQD